MTRTGLLVPLCLGILALIGFFQFPGHTWLQADTQIYKPMLERLLDPTLLTRDFMVTRPHLTFTLYDETAVLLRKLTGLGFREVLGLEQLFFRALGLYGLFLLARSFHISDRRALFVVALVSLGELVVGPSVLTIEYEPVPRGFAMPLLLLTMGLAVEGRLTAAGFALAGAFLYHPPTVFPFLAVYVCMLLWPATGARGQLARTLAPLGCALALLLVFAYFQPEVTERQPFFGRIGADQERLQRFRATYNWVSLWPVEVFWSYVVLWGLSLVAYFRLRQDAPRLERWLLVGLPVVGLLSVPVSYLMLEQAKWAFIPQFQPARALLFVDVMALVLAAAAAVKEAAEKRFVRSVLWFLLVFLIPVFKLVLSATPSDALFVRRAAVVLALALTAAGAAFMDARGWRWSWAGLAVAALAPYWIIPACAHIENYPQLETAELNQLVDWARNSTPKDAVFLFPDAGHALYPGVLRANAMRALYIDWKSGGQVNYFADLGEEWWRRWEETIDSKAGWKDIDRFGKLGVDYVVLRRDHRLEGRTAVFENARYVAYRPGL